VADRAMLSDRIKLRMVRVKRQIEGQITIPTMQMSDALVPSGFRASSALSQKPFHEASSIRLFLISSIIEKLMS
jgi:hypothetical protein